MGIDAAIETGFQDVVDYLGLGDVLGAAAATGLEAGGGGGFDAAAAGFDAGGGATTALQDPGLVGPGAAALGSAAGSAAPSGVDIPDYLTGGIGADVGGGAMQVGTQAAEGGDKFIMGGGDFAPASPSLESSLSIGSGINDPGVGETTGGYIAGNPVSASVAASAPAAAAPPPSSIGTAINDPTWGNVGRALSSNANILLPGAALAYTAVRGDRPLEGEGPLRDAAAKLGMQGEQLQSYLASGTVPPGLQASLNAAKESAKATIRSQYAARGMSGSSSERRDLANVEMQAAAKGGEMAIQLLQQGVQLSGLSSQLYRGLLDNALKKDQALTGAIGRFAGAAAGLPASGLTLQIGK